MYIKPLDRYEKDIFINSSNGNVSALRNGTDA